MSCVCLLIDDDPDDQEIFALAANAVGLNVELITAKDGVEGLDYLRSDQSLVPDFIFVDLNMPRKNGRDVIRELVAIEKAHKANLILYSTSADNPAIIKEMHALGVRVVAKPSAIDDLVRILSDVFKSTTKCE